MTREIGKRVKMDTKEDIKTIIRRGIYLILLFIGIGYSNLMAHELGHKFVHDQMGHDSKIVIEYFRGYVTADGPIWESTWLTRSAGGLVGGTFALLFFWLPAYISPTIRDTYLELAAFLIGISQYIYAFWEVQRLGIWWWWIPEVITIVILIYPIYYYLKKLYRYFFQGLLNEIN